MSAPEFFIDDDAFGLPWVWRKNGDHPVHVLDLMDLTRHPDGRALLDLIRAAVEGEVREEWGVLHLNGWVDGPHAERDARSIAGAWEDELTLVRRTVITGAWEEER